MSDKPALRPISVGVKDKSDNWEIRTVNMTLDPGDSFRPVIPMRVKWPDGLQADYLRVGKSGRMLYKQV